jgi:hypothetical protein
MKDGLDKLNNFEALDYGPARPASGPNLLKNKMEASIMIGSIAIKILELTRRIDRARKKENNKLQNMVFHLLQYQTYITP